MRFLRWLLRRIWVFFLTYVLVSFLVLATLFFTAKYWAPKIISYCEQRSGEALDAQVQIIDLRIARLWPLTLGFENIHAQSHARTWRLDLERLEVGLGLSGVVKDWHRPVLDLHLHLKSPRVDYVPPPSTGPTLPWTQYQITWPRMVPPAEPALVVADLDTRISIEDGTVNFQGQQPWNLTELGVTGRWPSLRSPDWTPNLNLEGQFARIIGRQSLRLPVHLSLAKMLVNAEKFELSESRMALGPVRAQGRGLMNWVDGQGQFHFAVEPTDLKDMPETLMPKGRWQGHFKGEATLNLKDGRPAEWSIVLGSEGVKGEIDQVISGTEMKGEVGVEARMKMTTGSQLLIDELALGADFTKARLARGNYFEKRIGQTFFIDILADGRENNLTLRRAFLRLAGLRLEGQGQVRTADPGTTQIRLQIPSTLAMGLEDLFPQFRGTPFRGHLQGDMELSGDWRKPESLELAIRSLKWAGAVVEFSQSQFGDFAVKGPLGLDLELDGLVKSGSADYLKVKMKTDGTALDIQSGPWRKWRGQSFHFDIAGRFSPEKWDLTDWKVELLNSRIRTTGAILWGSVIKPNLIFYFDSNDLKALQKLCLACPWQVGGRLDGRLGLSGAYNPSEKWAGSPLVLQGELRFSQNVLNWIRPTKDLPAKSAALAGSPTTAAPVEETNSILPNWPLFRNSNIALNVDGGPWRLGELDFRQVKLQGLHSLGKLSLKGELTDPANGKVYVKQMIFTPTATPSGLDAEINWDKLLLGPLIGWMAPSYRQFISGRVSGHTLILGPIPGLPKWQEQIKVEGKMHLSEAQIATWSWQDLLKDALKRKLMMSKILLGQGRQFSGDIEWSMQNQKVEIPHLILESDKKDILNLRGQAELAGALHLDGTLALSVNEMRVNPSVKVEGTLKEPKFNVLLNQ